MVVTDEAVPAASVPALLKRVSWGAILAGALITVALTALFGLLGLGIGLGNFDVGDSLSGIPKSTLLWWAVSTIVATGIGAFVAARFAGIPRGLTGALHGLAVWAVATLLTLWLATSAVGFALGAASKVVTTTARVTTGAVSTAGGAIIGAGGAVVPSPSSSDVSSAKAQVQQEAQQVLARAGVGQQDVNQAQSAIGTAAQNIAMRPGTAGEEINRLIDRLFEGPNAALSPQERDQLVTALAQEAGMSRQQANDVASRWQAQANTAWANVRRTGTDTANRIGQTAGRVGDKTLDVLSDAAWGMFWISLAGLVAALLGAALGGASLGLGLLGAEAVAVADDDDHDYDEDVRPARRPPPPPRR